MKISKKSLFYNAAVLAASGVLLQIIGFVYRVYLSRVAGAEGLGVYRLVFPAYSVIYAATITGTRMAATKLSAALPAIFRAFPSWCGAARQFLSPCSFLPPCRFWCLTAQLLSTCWATCVPRRL